MMAASQKLRTVASGNWKQKTGENERSNRDLQPPTAKALALILRLTGVAKPG
jgi:hypothetical protein